MRCSRIGVVAAIAAAALVLPASAVAQGISSISIGPGQLGLQGASVTVPVTLTCDPGFSLAGLTIDPLAQSKGGRLAQGTQPQFFGQGSPCSSPVTVSVPVPDNNPFAFKVGKAVATALVELFKPSGGLDIQTVTQAISIVKK
jgi:hypothetical protein